MTATDHDQGRFGSGFFLTQDGLIAEGDGVLSGLAGHNEMVEFRTNQSEHLPPKGQHALFLRGVFCGGDPILLFGIVTRFSDAMGRKGIFGVCVGLSSDETELSRHVDVLFELFEEAIGYYNDEYSNTRHATNIGYLRPDTDKQVLQRMGPEDSYLVFGESEDVGLKASADLLGQLGKKGSGEQGTMLLWIGRGGSNPLLTQEMVAKAAHKFEQARAAQENAHMQERMSLMDERREVFNERTTYLRHPRPDDIGPKDEDYILGLIEFYMEQKGISGNHRGGHRQQQSSYQAPAVAQNSAGSFDSGDTRFVGAGRNLKFGNGSPDKMRQIKRSVSSNSQGILIVGIMVAGALLLAMLVIVVLGGVGGNDKVDSGGKPIEEQGIIINRIGTGSLPADNTGESPSGDGSGTGAASQ